MMGTLNHSGGMAMMGGDSQLDKVEKKMDKILELLEHKELSIKTDGKVRKMTYAPIRAKSFL